MLRMLKTKSAALVIAGTAILAALPGAKASDIDQAAATVSGIEANLGAARRDAGYFFEVMGRAQNELQWHARAAQQIGAQMNRYQCGRPATRAIWQYCAALHRDMQENARRSQYLNWVVATNRANHQAAVHHIAQLNQAGHVWKTHLAMLKGEKIVVASTD